MYRCLLTQTGPIHVGIESPAHQPLGSMRQRGALRGLLTFTQPMALVLGLSLCWTLVGPVQAQGSTAPAAPTAAAAAPAALAVQSDKGPPAGFVAPPEPKADETNTQRAKSQPGNNAPFWRDVRQSSGYSSLPGAETGNLVQGFTKYPGSRLTTAGEAWRQVRNQWIIPYGGALVLIAVLALALFYWRRGPLGGHLPDTGRKVERFTPFERAAHWTNAIAFVVLGVSGLVMAFGKFILLPVIGASLFGWLTYALKTAHNLVGPLFAVSLVIVIITFIKDNFPGAADIRWLLKGGGMFGGDDVPSHRFNGGEKVLFWLGICGAGLVAVGSGLYLDKVLPGMDYLRSDMQVANMVHGVSTLIMVSLLLGHIYMGTLGMKGAYSAMRTGYVDEAWAREHHALWHDDIVSGKIPRQRSPVLLDGAPGTLTDTLGTAGRQA